MLFYNCKRWQNLFFFAISLIMLISPAHSPFLWWIIVLPLACNFLVYILKEYLLDLFRS